MSKNARALLFFLCLSVIAAGSARAQNPDDKYLTGSDIEKVTGMKGIHAVPRGSIPGAAGDLNFADASGELILMIQFTDAAGFNGLKTRYAQGAVSGVGDQAVQGAAIPGMPDNLLAFTKRTRCVVLTAFGDFIKKKLYLTVDQLVAIGKIIASRL